MQLIKGIEKFNIIVENLYNWSKKDFVMG